MTSIFRYSFADKMRERVPQLRAQVSQTAFDDLQGFLTDIRDRVRQLRHLIFKPVFTYSVVYFSHSYCATHTSCDVLFSVCIFVAC